VHGVQGTDETTEIREALLPILQTVGNCLMRPIWALFAILLAFSSPRWIQEEELKVEHTISGWSLSLDDHSGDSPGGTGNEGTPPVAEGVRGSAEAASAGAVASIELDRAARLQSLWGQDAPLIPFAQGLLTVSDQAGIDWRIPAAMAVLESSSGRQACAGNAWGLGSCKGEYGQFETFDIGIRAVVKTLASQLYKGLTPREVFCQWVSGDRACPDAHSQDYAAKGLRMMERLQ